MTKIKTILTVLLISIASPAHSMENAPDAPNDGRTVPLIIQGSGKNCTGFLYSEKIVLTAGHCIFDRYTQNLLQQQYIGKPGMPYVPNSNEYELFPIEKTFSNWKIKTGTDYSDTDDFAVLVLKNKILVPGKVYIATKEQVDSYIKNKAMVTTIGYGLQSKEHKQNDFTKPKYAQFPLVSNERISAVKSEVYSYSGVGHYGMKIHVLQVPGGPSTCSGDSGSPFYIKDGENFIYLGPLSWGFGGIPNCSGSGWKTNEMNMGSVAAYDYLSLIKEAEDYVAKQNVVIIPTPTASSLTKKSIIKITIKCYKEKEIKKIYGINPKCPKGYKVKV
jgi:secreted trypsin-like serine protease